MGRAPSQKTTATLEDKRIESDVRRLMEALSKRLVAVQAREGLTQEEMAQRLNLSLARYKSFLDVEKVNFSFGCSIAMITRMANVEKISVADLITALDEGIRKKSTPIEIIISELQHVPLDDQKTFASELGKDIINPKFMPNRMRWGFKLLNMIFELPISRQIEVELQVIRWLLERKKSQEVAEELRKRARVLMRSQLEADEQL